MEHFLLFEATLPKTSLKLEVRPFEKRKATEALYKAKNAIEQNLWSYAPVDHKKLSTITQPFVSKISSTKDLSAAFSSTSAGKLETRIQETLTEKIVPKDESEVKKAGERNAALLDIAFLSFSGALFQKALPPVAVKSEGTPTKDMLRLAAYLPDWTSVRKCKTTAPSKEVFATLVALRSGIEKKLASYCATPDFAKALEGALLKIPERKSWGRITEALQAVQQLNVATHADKTFSFSQDVLTRYVFNAALSRVGFAPYCSNDAVGSAWPEFKIQKPRGRIKKD
ncbi:MAG TPA: hypothetical protein VGQ00_02935 [Candidatus Norongarragalinales archaeon]|nr:hypothetical protein [Candidatus Norongarragalinales archaeon]